MSRRLPASEHTSRPWRIHEITPDFEVEDVWAIRTPGAGPHDFLPFTAALRAAEEVDDDPPLVRFLFAVRWKLGALLGWDDEDKGLAGRVESLCDRLPNDLRQGLSGRTVGNSPFTELYELPDESASEIANKTCHGVCHLGWVPGENGDHELRMTVLVKLNGRFGRLYLTAIKPFRYLIVYPALTRKWERVWLELATPTELAASAPAGSQTQGEVA